MFCQKWVKFGTSLAVFNNNPAKKNWEDVWAYRFGTQYAITPKIDLRAGYAYDTTPAPNDTVGPELPDADRHNFSVGTGFHNDLGSVDLAYMWVHWIDRTVTTPNSTGIAGTFKSDAYLFAAAVTLKF